jgi:hypothetical protein
MSNHSAADGRRDKAAPPLRLDHVQVGAWRHSFSKLEIVFCAFSTIEIFSRKFR